MPVSYILIFVNWEVYIYKYKFYILGLAIMNPSAKSQIRQYAQSVSDLFKLMIQEKEVEFRTRVKKVKFFIMLIKIN
jgi:prephenate dehydrogenase (NADP+)